MMGRTKARSRSRQPEHVFIDFNGRTYPISNIPDLCLNKSTIPAAASKTATHVDKTLGSKQIKTTSVPSKRVVDQQTASMSAQTVIYIGPQDSQVESSKSGTARQHAQTSNADIAPVDTDLESNSESGQRRDSLSCDSSASPARGLSLRLSPVTSEIDTPASSPYSWSNTNTASMHSDQDFDLGYKGRPAKPFCYRVHTRVWSSAYTRPVKDMFREILEVRYPEIETADEERMGLLSGWSWSPRGLFTRNL